MIVLDIILWIIGVMIGLLVYLFVGKLIRITLIELFWRVGGSLTEGKKGWREWSWSELFTNNEESESLAKCLWPLILGLGIVFFIASLVGRIVWLIWQAIKIWAKAISFCFR